MRAFTSLFLLFVAAPAFAEPAKGSPEAEVFQVIGDTEITITYSRPGVKGRVIWGELVPYGEIWRAGANDKTAIEFGSDVVIAGKTIPAGIYSFYILPEKEEWTLILNTNWEGHGTEYDADADILRITVTPEDAPHEEWLRYGFDQLENEACVVYLHWEKKKASFRIEAPQD